MKIFLCLLLIWLSTATLSGQNDKRVQLSFPSTQYSEPIAFTACDSNGICVLYQQQPRKSDSTDWHLLYYDVDFNLLHQADFKLPSTQTRITSTYNNGNFVILYRNIVKRKNNLSGCLVHFNIHNKLLSLEAIDNLPDCNLSQVKICGDNLLFVCASNNETDNLCYYPFGSHSINSLTIQDTPTYNIEDYLFDTVVQQVVVCLKTKSDSKNQNILWLCKTDLNGHLLFATDFPDTLNDRFQNTKIRQIGASEYIAFGTYQTRNNNSAFYTSSGIYSIHFKNNQFDIPKTYPFENGKPPEEVIFSNCDIRYLIGNIIQHDDRFAIIIESYYPIYRYSQSSMTYGETYMTRTLAGYCFMNAYVKTFDARGDLVSEYTFPFDNMHVESVNSHLTIYFLPNEILFYYMKGVSLISLLTDKNFNIIDPLRMTLLVDDTHDNSTATVYYTESRLLPWYDDNFIFAARRKSYYTRHRSEESSTYYVNKLKFE